MTNAIYTNYINETEMDKMAEGAMASFGARVALYEKYNYSLDSLFAMTRKERSDLQHECGNTLDSYFYGGNVSKEEYELAYELYFAISSVEDKLYYEENIDAFLEYQSHMGEPDFDWDFYSDWHKDMYGFRPR